MTSLNNFGRPPGQLIQTTPACSNDASILSLGQTIPGFWPVRVSVFTILVVSTDRASLEGFPGRHLFLCVVFECSSVTEHSLFLCSLHLNASRWRLIDFYSRLGSETGFAGLQSASLLRSKHIKANVSRINESRRTSWSQNLRPLGSSIKSAAALWFSEGVFLGVASANSVIINTRKALPFMSDL